MFQYIKIKNVAIISAFIVFIISSSTSFGLNNKIFAAPIDLPKVSFNHNGGITDLSPTLTVKDKIMTKVGQPEDTETIRI